MNINVLIHLSCSWIFFSNIVYILSLIVMLLFNLTVAMLEVSGGNKMIGKILFPICSPQVIGITK